MDFTAVLARTMFGEIGLLCSSVLAILNPCRVVSVMVVGLSDTGRLVLD